MADEVPGSNTIRVTRDGSRWCALIGPDPQRGLAAFGDHPFQAVERLLRRCHLAGWVWDESWRER